MSISRFSRPNSTAFFFLSFIRPLHRFTNTIKLLFILLSSVTIQFISRVSISCRYQTGFHRPAYTGTDSTSWEFVGLLWLAGQGMKTNIVTKVQHNAPTNALNKVHLVHEYWDSYMFRYATPSDTTRHDTDEHTLRGQHSFGLCKKDTDVCMRSACRKQTSTYSCFELLIIIQF